MADAPDRFFEPYSRDQIAFGDVPSAPLAAYLHQVGCGGRAIDLGAGAGRDTIALARAGYEVLAIDLSARGAERISQRAQAAGVGDLVRTHVTDLCDYVIEPNGYDAICATTVLDHLNDVDARRLWQQMVAGLRDRGVIYVEVHTTEDPGSDRFPGCQSDAPVSETADVVINYFAPNQLVGWALADDAALRILRYEERLEWDYTHGSEHLHGKAVLLAVKAGYHPPWYGQPAAFPRRSDQRQRD